MSFGCLAFFVAELVPSQCQNCELDTILLLFWQDLLNVLHLLNMCLGCCRVVPNLTSADHHLAQLVVFLINGHLQISPNQEKQVL